MKTNIFKELPLWALIAFPFVYLYLRWDQLPDRVALHYNARGDADRWGDKSEMVWIFAVALIGSYLILLIARSIDPKKKLSSMGPKFYMIRLLLVLLLSAIFSMMIYSQTSGNMNLPNGTYLILGVLFIFLGNYFRSLKPNYFIGFRTPWTLESEVVWRKTHRYNSVVWMIGGSSLVLTNLILQTAVASPVNMFIIGLMIVIPIGYSYWQYRLEEKQSGA